MPGSSIADRYLQTLESNALENKRKSPPKSIRSMEKNLSPTKSSPLLISKSPIKSLNMSPGRSSMKGVDRTVKTLSNSSRRSPQKELVNRSIISDLDRAKDRNSYSYSSVRSAAGAAMKDSPSATKALGPKPDRNPLMHNEDLTPSEVMWDKERQNWQTYEYLCHVVEAKEWMEKLLNEKLPAAEEFPASLQNGVTLAKVVQKLRPDLMKWPIFMHKRLQYRHTENITLFFDFLESLRIPQLFLFDMTDLYEKRNLPKVIYCIHAVSHFIAESDFALSAVDNLVGKLKFSDDQLIATERGLVGRTIPNFGAMTRKLSGKHPQNDMLCGIDEDDELCDNNYHSSRNTGENEYTDDFSDDGDDSEIKINPPRCNRNSDDYKDRVNSLMASTRAVSRDMYHESFVRAHGDTPRSYSYRNLSSLGSLRHRVLTSAERMLMELEELEPEIIDLQSVCRSVLIRRHLAGQKHLPVRRDTYSEGSHVYMSSKEIKALVKLQSVARTALVCRKFKASTLATNKLTTFQALARGVLTRIRIERLKNELRCKTAVKSLTYLQSTIRGNITRGQLRCLSDDLNNSFGSIITALQAMSRGVIVRRNKAVTEISWAHNIDKIILIQSVWRAKAQGSCYRTLIADANPSLEAIKPFLHLIDNKPEDYQLESELESVTKEISRKMKENTQLETSIEQLDMKIALLVKNNISIDELVLKQHQENELIRYQSLKENYHGGKRHSNKFAHGINGNSGGVFSGLYEQFDMSTLTKHSRDRIELYQGLLHILQTQPAYLSNLMSYKSSRSLDMPDLVLAIFQNGTTPRDMFFLLRQLAQSITQYTVGSPQNTVAWCIIGYLNQRKEASETAKVILKPGTDKIKVLLDQLLEYDPHILYEHLTGGDDLSAEEAIQNHTVRAAFVQNLQRLREITLSIVQSLAQNMQNLPYHIKFIAKEVYNEVLAVTKDRSEAMASVGQVIISQYLQPAFISADSLNLVDAAAGHTAKNLSLVSRVLHQIGLMTSFNASSGTDIYLQPLNEFVKSCAHQLSISFHNLITDCPDLQAHFQINEHDDIIMHERPILNITMEHLTSVHNMCYHHLNSIAAENDIVLRPVVEKLGPLPRDAREMLDLARFKEIRLELNPKFSSVSLNEPDGDNSSLLATTKRCLGYVLRVQSNQPDLMAVLIAPVELEDEHKYMLILDSENTRESAGDLANLSFRELKLLTLEKVLELESFGAVSRKNGYQTLINAIADDIRNKNFVRQKMRVKITSKTRTLVGIEEKGRFLRKRVEMYNQSINEAMKALQTKAASKLHSTKTKPFHRFQLPNAKQNNNYMQNSRYGTYKASAEKLHEKGILIRLHGYNERQYKDIQFTFSCEEVGIFQIDVSYKSILLPGGSLNISLDDMLAQQYQNLSNIDLMGGELQFNNNRLLKLILMKFFGSSS